MKTRFYVESIIGTIWILAELPLFPFWGSFAVVMFGQNSGETYKLSLFNGIEIAAVNLIFLILNLSSLKLYKEKNSKSAFIIIFALIRLFLYVMLGFYYLTFV